MLGMLAVGLAAQQLPRPGAYDLVIEGGTLVDGSGRIGWQADVAVQGDHIAAIGDLASASRKRTIDAKGLVVSPGFIDMHNHSDDSLLDEPKCESMIRQGVTTMVLGEGASQGPVHAASAQSARPWTTLGGYFDYVEKKHAATNIASYVGETQIWTYVKGEDLTPATPGEMEKMKEQVALAMQDGAMGLSTSLLMPPSNLITTAQLIDVAKVARQYGGIYATHMRDEGSGVFRSVAESIAIAKGANIRVDILHLKIADKKFWGQMNEVVSMIAKARADGYDVRANVYPYTAGQNDLRAIVPPWAHDGGNAKMLERLRDPALRPRLRNDITSGLPEWYDHYLAVGGDWNAMLLVSLSNPKNTPFIGKRMTDVLAARGGDPVDVLLDLLIEENGSVPTVFFHHSEPDMQYALKQTFVSIGSDGLAISPEGPRGTSIPHPRSYGTFPRVLGRYVRELNTITLEDAVRKMTSENADKISLRDRGRIQVGLAADITVFDPNTISDRATFVQPHQYAVGMSYVIVNGQVVLNKGEHTGALPGRVLRGPGYVRVARAVGQKKAEERYQAFLSYY
jgi:N-acyl-D-aspartate/D-glutamate deacylase